MKIVFKKPAKLLCLAAVVSLASACGGRDANPNATIATTRTDLVAECDPTTAIIPCPTDPGAGGGTSGAPAVDPFRQIHSPFTDPPYGDIDWDQDGIPDALELQLAQRDYPYLISDPTDRLLWHGYPYSYADARIYFRVRTYTPAGDGVSECSQPFQCLELDFAEPWEYDSGRNGLTSHNGDSEFSSVLVSRTTWDGQGGADWATARQDAGWWGIVATGQDSHGGRRFSAHRNNWPSAGRPKMYVSYAKHATYVTRDDCTSTKLKCVIACVYERCDLTGQDQLTRDYTDLNRLANIGSLFGPGGTHYGTAYADGFTGRFPNAGVCDSSNPCPHPAQYNYYDSAMPFGAYDSDPYVTHFDKAYTSPNAGSSTWKGFFWKDWLHNCAATGYAGGEVYCGKQIEVNTAPNNLPGGR